MKAIIIFLYLSFCSFFSFSQLKTRLLKTEDVLPIELGSKISAEPAISHIRGIEVLDLRDDTTSMGYSFSSFYKKTSRIIFDGPTAYVVSKWIGNYLKIDKGNFGDKLLVCIKKLRLSNEARVKVFEHGHEGQPQNGWDEGILINIEFYLHREEFYYPLYRYDSVLNIDGKLPGDASMFVTTAFSSVLSKFFTINIEQRLTSARKLNLEEILSRRNKQTHIPIFTETAYKKGVYKTFEEFKMNAPSVTEYEYKKGKLGDVLYVKEGKNEFPDRMAWGFCDGKNVFINSSDIFSELIRDGNTFYFKGIKSITKTTRHRLETASLFNLATNTGQKRSAYSVDSKYYQIDMETGEVY